MRESTLRFGAIGEVPVEKEKLMVQETERALAQCCVSEDERKSDLAHAWRGKPRAGGVQVSLGHRMGGKVQNMGPGAGRWEKHEQRQFVLLTSCSVTSDQ